MATVARSAGNASASVSLGALAQPSQQKEHDPFTSVEAMYNGCLTRLAYALRDPKNYAESTPFVVAEVSKKYQDKLDDVEIMVLDMKWLLEEKLAQNKAKREAAAREREANAMATSASAKRKHDDVEELQETPSKRQKSMDQPSPRPSTAAHTLAVTDIQAQPMEKSQSQQSQHLTSQPQTSRATPKDASTPAEKQESKPDQPQLEVSSQSDPNFNLDDFPRPSAQNTPAMTNDHEDLFESMFGEPTDDDTNMDNPDTMNFDMNNNDFNPDTNALALTTNANTQNLSQQRPISQTQSQNQIQTDQSSIGAILPGLEQYANQPDDNSMQAQNTLNAGDSNIFSAEFAPNIFDDFLNDDTLDGGNEGDMGNMKIENPGDTNFNFDDLFGDGD